jgi:hypothetical protein
MQAISMMRRLEITKSNSVMTRRRQNIDGNLRLRREAGGAERMDLRNLLEEDCDRTATAM